MRVLITGGAGYIGSHTTRLMNEAGFETVVYDNLSRGNRWSVRSGHFIVGDLSDKRLLVSTLKNFGIEAVIHFAASAYVGESMDAPEQYFRNNLINSLILLEAMKDVGVKTIIFSSTCATYGYPVELPIREEHPQNPVNPYGESKLMIERALHWHGICHGLKWVALRYFNAAGGHPDGTIGEMHTPETHLIPTVIAAALGRVAAVDIYGTDYPTADRTAIRDYIHVLDLGEAHIRALGYLINGGDSRAVNLGTGNGYSVRRIIAAVEAVSGKEVPFRERPRRPGDPAILVAEPSLASKILGWRPEYSDLATIIETAYRWEMNPQRADIAMAV